VRRDWISILLHHTDLKEGTSSSTFCCTILWKHFWWRVSWSCIPALDKILLQQVWWWWWWWWWWSMNSSTSVLISHSSVSATTWIQVDADFVKGSHCTWKNHLVEIQPPQLFFHRCNFAVLSILASLHFNTVIRMASLMILEVWEHRTMCSKKQSRAVT